MKCKHPSETAPLKWEELRQVSSVATPDIDPDLVRKKIYSFGKGSAGGPTGLRPQHLKDAQH